jgi:HSP20 family protein
MNTLVRLHNLNRLRPAFEPSMAANDLFTSFFRPLTDAQPDLRIDVSEDDKAYRVAAAIPGVRKEDIHVAVDKNEVTIEAEIKREVAAEGERTLLTERFYGKAQRSFVVAQDIDESAVEAKYADGILTLVLPKKVAAAAKRIAIN